MSKKTDFRQQLAATKSRNAPNWFPDGLAGETLEIWQDVIEFRKSPGATRVSISELHRLFLNAADCKVSYDTFRRALLARSEL